METIKNIIGYEGLYTISIQGKIKSPYPTKSKDGIMKPSLHHTGYYVISLTKNGVRNQYSLHRLLAAHFIPNPESKPCINHKNGIRSDYRIENLEWCTYMENLIHAHVNNRFPSKIRSIIGTHTQTGEQISFFSICQAAKKLNGSKGNIFTALKNNHLSAYRYKWAYELAVIADVSEDEETE